MSCIFNKWIEFLQLGREIYKTGNSERFNRYLREAEGWMGFQIQTNGKNKQAKKNTVI